MNIFMMDEKQTEEAKQLSGFNDLSSNQKSGVDCMINTEVSHLMEGHGLTLEEAIKTIQVGARLIKIIHLELQKALKGGKE